MHGMHGTEAPSEWVRRWSHLERQQGGIGTRGGPGEAQIELDRRMIGDRIKQVKERLEKVKRQRGTQRRARERRGTFRVSLVGYTNAGKSTLFNALVKARSYAADQLFATLDTTTRALWLGEAQAQVSLSDTVGFIRDLPHKLVEAFEATLQEAADADLLLHVVDAASPVLDEQMAEVERVLAEIGAADVPQILVYNKCDLLEPSLRSPGCLGFSVQRSQVEPDLWLLSGSWSDQQAMSGYFASPTLAAFGELVQEQFVASLDLHTFA